MKELTHFAKTEHFLRGSSSDHRGTFLNTDEPCFELRWSERNEASDPELVVTVGNPTAAIGEESNHLLLHVE